MSSLTLMAYLSMLGVLVFCLLLSRHLFPFLLVPAALGSIRFVGEVLQEEHLGPIWAQHHLGDVGIISNNMTWGFLVAIMITAHKNGDLLAELRSRPESTFRASKQFRNVAGSRIPLAFFVVSLLLYILAMLAEFQTAFAQSTLTGKEAKANYSGEFDWLDAVVYTIGMTAMTLNYIFIAPKVRRRILLQQAK